MRLITTLKRKFEALAAEEVTTYAAPPGPSQSWASRTIRTIREGKLIFSGLGTRVHSVAPALVGALVAMGVCAPFLRGGRLYLLDWVLEPHGAIVPASFYGASPTFTAAMPGQLLADLAGHLPWAGTWLPLAVFFPLASGAAGRLTGGGAWARTGSGLLYAVNPFVFERIYAGQLLFLLAYALFPFYMVSVWRSLGVRPRAGPEPSGLGRLVPALWLALLVALSPNMAWIGVVALAVTALVTLTRRPRLLGIGRALAIAGAFLATSAYLVLPSLGAGGLSGPGGLADLAAYRTAGDARLGLYTNVAGLYGFWRAGPRLPKDLASGWPLLLVVILLVAAVGGVSALRSNSRWVAASLMGMGLVGGLLALGNQGPTGSLFQWAYVHIPFFNVMREPEKFSALLAMAYAVAFGWGLDRLVSTSRSRPTRYLNIALALGLPLAYTPTIFYGLDSQVASSVLPASWGAADRLMVGSGQALVLPWHEYLAFPFTDQRTIANPFPGAFDRGVIAGDDVELPNVYSESGSARSAFLQKLFTHGRDITTAGSLLAPLGIRYVVLTKVVDWRSYSWLGRQRDLTPIFSSRDLEVWKVDQTVSDGFRTSNLVATALGGRLGDGAALGAFDAVTGQRGGPAPFHGKLDQGSVVQRSPVQVDVSPGPPGWAVLDLPYDPNWHSGRHSPVPLAEGNMAVAVGRAPTEVTDGHFWGRVVPGYGLTLAVLAILLLGRLAWDLGSGRRSKKSSSDPSTTTAGRKALGPEDEPSHLPIQR
jgi:hypothetical protein